MNNVIREKKEFVDALKPALTKLSGITDIQYEHFSDKYMEIVMIAWEDDYCDYINVTANSLEAILREIARQVSAEPATGLIANDKHKVIIEEWFKSKKAQSDCAWK